MAIVVELEQQKDNQPMLLQQTEIQEVGQGQRLSACAKFRRDVLRPDTFAYKAREWVLFFLTCYDAMMLPFPAFFVKEAALIVVMLNLLVDVIFIINIILNFWTCFRNSYGQIVSERKVIRARYKHGWFILDVVSCFPSELLFMFISKFEKYAGLFRLTRMLRLGRLWRSTVSFVTSKNNVLKVVRNLLYFIFFCHWMGGIFFFAGQVQTESNIYTGNRWTVEANIANADLPTQYLTSLYFSVVTCMSVGYGDIKPHTNSEKILSLMFICSGSVFYAVILSNVSIALSAMAHLKTAHNNALAQLHRASDFMKVDSEVQHKMSQKMIEFYTVTKGLDLDTQIKALPTRLQIDFLMKIRAHIVQEFTWFKFAPTHALEFIVRCLRNTVYASDDKICGQDEVSGLAGWVCNGSASKGRISGRGGEHFDVKEVFVAGCDFGFKNLLTHKPRTTELRAMTVCEIAALRRHDLHEIYHRFPTIFIKLGRALDDTSDHQSSNDLMNQKLEEMENHQLILDKNLDAIFDKLNIKIPDQDSLKPL